MCGIAGKFDFTGAIVEKSLIRHMCRELVHRGPDAEGIHTAPYIGLGERRLSIIDLSEDANPPLANEDCSLWVVFNGEIYNFAELRAGLIAEGHVFRTSTDTEVLLHLYEKHGTDCLRHLRGMFAFAIWDSTRRVLFAARDRLGKKPLFYTKTPTSFLFASSIRALLADPEVSASPNFAAIDRYLSYQYVPSPLTAFSGIFKLPSGHYLLSDLRGEVFVEKYWSPRLVPKTTATEREIESELVERLRESVRMRLISDVPLGAFLSGGMDSSTVVALMAMESSKPVKTFSVGFEQNGFNELPYARKVAERFGTEHHEFVVRPSAAEVLPLLVRHYGEPFADSSAVPTYYVSQMARRHVTVALSGDGGDESFAGYQHYKQTGHWGGADFIPWAIRRRLARIAQGALDHMPYSNRTARVARGFQMIGSRLPERYLTQISIVKPQEKRACYTPYFRSLLNGSNGAGNLRGLPWTKSVDSLDWIMLHDQQFYLPDCLMVKTDVASMANSLEVRCPFLDHPFVEFAATIPSALKRNGTGGKVILKRAMRKLLPAEILDRGKTGFGMPLASWFRGELADMLKATLLDDIAAKRGLLNQSFLKRMVEEHISGKRDWSTRLWAFLFLELWFRELVD